MIKPSNNVIELSKDINNRLDQAKNVDAAIERLQKERAEKINVYISDTLAELKALGLSFKKDDDNSSLSEVTRFDISFKGLNEFDHGVIVFSHSEDKAECILNVSLGRYMQENIDKDTFYLSYLMDNNKTDNKKASKKLALMADVCGAFSKAFEVIESEYNSYKKDIISIVKDFDSKLRDIKNQSSDPLTLKGELMKAVATEVYKAMAKKKSFDFQPKNVSELIKTVEKNKDFFFSMDGQADTWGERSRLNMYGDNDSAYKAVVTDFVNTDVKGNIKKMVLPYMVDKGGYNAFAVKSVSIEKIAKNAKMKVKPYIKDDVHGGYGDGGYIEVPRKSITNQTDESPISDVFYGKGGMIGVLALFTNELNEYMKLFK